MTFARHRWIVALALVALLPACGPKKAKTTPDLDANTVTTPSTPTTDVEPRPQAEPVDKTPDPLAGDIAAVNDYLAANGLLGDVYFDFDKSDLREDARARLARNAEWLRAHPEFEVAIEGHCDERGTNEYNLALGERRAAAAKDCARSRTARSAPRAPRATNRAGRGIAVPTSWSPAGPASADPG